MKKLILTLILATSSIVASAQWYAQSSVTATASAQLDGRGVEGSLPRPSYDVNSDCTVVVTVWVDNFGKVVKAQAGAYGTTTTNRSIWAAAREAAMNTRFKQKMDAPALQEGSIKYTFWAGNNETNAPINTGAIKFLGIPIDGSDSQFSERLQNKGFAYSPVKECYKGQFNGQDVDVYLHTNHGIMDRVYVAFPYTSAGSVKVAFNTLLSQFEKSGKYLSSGTNEALTDKDDISYEITVNNKRYQASFSYYDPNRDSVSFLEELLDNVSKYFTEEEMAKMKETARKALAVPESEREAVLSKMQAEIQEQGLTRNEKFDEAKSLQFLADYLDGMRSIADGEVWFMIHERYGKFQIGLYYDNLHNRPHGEDL